ncbi:uncharacterized protein LOC131659343 [Vicia villosa]|uniref:uncharacterized protein LOC131659343 n=1 Tax=Vicia villosa TaxID=3911 RepID=UPI00273BC0C0|nr:uncharacterized protein LOC131659343 [Vicia villosa]
MGEDEKVAEYVSKVQKLVHLMKGCGEILTDKMIVEKLQITMSNPRSSSSIQAARITLLVKRFPTKKLKKKVPEKVWSGKRPSVSHLKMFGSMCYKHVPDLRIRELDDKSEPMILVGYHKTSAYRLLNLDNAKIMLCRDIVVVENSAWDWNLSNSINKSFMSSDFEEATAEFEVSAIFDTPVEVEAVSNILDTAKVEEGVAATSQRPQRTRILPARLQDYEVDGDDEVTPDGEIVHFA